MKPTVSVFECSPDEGQGLARDMRVRWALEEVHQPYDVRLVSMKALKQPEHRALNPFGSIPTYEEDSLTLFESGAIVFHIAEHHNGLFPKDASARARAITWMFAALNTVEPPIVEWEMAQYFERDKSWREEHKAMIEKNINIRLTDLSKRLGDTDWVDGDFSAADILMVLVLRRLDGSRIVEQFPNLFDYVERGKARPAYKRAFNAQLEVFKAASASSRSN
jgi:glutathione S-transferase